MEYTIIIEDENGSAIHTATVTSTTYQYPQDAPELGWATLYLWSVNAELNNAEIGRRSERASFTTPFAPAGTVEATMENIGQMIKLVLSDYPQYASFLEKVLISISDESGPVTPEAFMELFETYKIISVSSQ